MANRPREHLPTCSLALRRNNDSLPNKYATLEEPSKFSLLTFPCFCILQYNYPLSCDTTIQVHWTYDTFKMANTPKSLFTRNNYSLLNKSMPLWLWFSPTKSMRLCRNPVSSLCSHFLVFCILQYNYPSSWLIWYQDPGTLNIRQIQNGKYTEKPFHAQ